jgi:hypothetical protein
MTNDRLAKINAALLALRTARDALAAAGATRAADYTRRALKSAEGAKRHAENMGARPHA